MSLFTSLRYLVALHQHKHFGRAAQACHVTQPALSNAIRALEAEFGTAIVKRGRAFECFTPEGERIFLTAQRMLREQELLQQSLRSTDGDPAGRLSIGAVPSVLPIAARFVGLLQKRHRRLSLSLRSLSSQEIEAGLEDLSLDLAWGYIERIEGRAATLASQWQYAEHYFLLQRAKRVSAKGLQMRAGSCTWAQAATEPLCLLSPDMHNRSIVDKAFAKAGVQVQPVIETNSILTLGMSVSVGDVASVLPGALVSVLQLQGELQATPLATPEVVTPIGIMYARTVSHSRALEAALRLADDAQWHAEVKAHSGLLRS